MMLDVRRGQLWIYTAANEQFLVIPLIPGEADRWSCLWHHRRDEGEMGIGDWSVGRFAGFWELMSDV